MGVAVHPRIVPAQDVALILQGRRKSCTERPEIFAIYGREDLQGPVTGRRLITAGEQAMPDQSGIELYVVIPDVPTGVCHCASDRAHTAEEVNEYAPTIQLDNDRANLVGKRNLVAHIADARSGRSGHSPPFAAPDWLPYARKVSCALPVDPSNGGSPSQLPPDAIKQRPTPATR